VKEETTALARIGGVTAPVDRAAYAKVGFGLMTFKYLVDAGLIFFASGEWLSPLIYLAPVATLRMEALTGGPAWLPVALVLWTLPFIWVGVSMTIRRARHANLPPSLGLLFFMPVVNYLFMLALCLVPEGRGGATPVPLRGDDRAVWAALTGVLSGAGFGLAMTLTSVFLLGEYGGALFLGTPFVMGAIASLVFNLRGPRGVGANMLLALTTVGVAGGLLLLFALEGALCLAMAFPIAAALCFMGVLLGRGLAIAEQKRALITQVCALPLFALAEPPQVPQVYSVTSAIDIEAAPEVVWSYVTGVTPLELEAPPDWFFELGIAYPTRAWLDGQGAGAVRHCEFSTGPFIEPITAWEPPHLLAFDVASQPPTMHEWSPYDTVYAPHLDGALQSRRGEFRLSPLPGGGTRLEGTTWYTFQMGPQSYWVLWSDALIGAIHHRVLRHIQSISEAA
jgi:uncharacterized membrane protein YhaH (DUF805 family)